MSNYKKIVNTNAAAKGVTGKFDIVLSSDCRSHSLYFCPFFKSREITIVEFSFAI